MNGVPNWVLENDIERLKNDLKYVKSDIQSLENVNRELKNANKEEMERRKLIYPNTHPTRQPKKGQVYRVVGYGDSAFDGSYVDSVVVSDESFIAKVIYAAPHNKNQHLLG